MNPQPVPQRKIPAILIGTVAISTATAIIYHSTWNAPALSWDDDYNIWKNPAFVTGPWWTVWLRAHYGMYIPVTSSFWMLLHRLGGGAPWIFRLFNFALHLLNTGLLGLLLSRAERLFSGRQAPFSWRVLLASLLFAIHPLQVATVAWISGTRDLLSAFFALAATALLSAEGPRRRRFIATFLFTAGLLSKPGIVAVPPALAILIRIFSPERFARQARWLALWVLISLGASFGTYLIQSEAIATMVPAWFRPVIALDSYGFLIEKLLLPWNLSADYGRTPGRIFADPVLMAWTLPLACTALGALTWLSRRKSPLRLGWSWFILLLPVSGVVPFAYQTISTVADHYHYLPMTVVSAGALLTLQRAEAWEQSRIPAGRRLPRAVIMACALIVCACLPLSSNRAKIWTSDRAFFSDMMEKNPESYSAAIGLSSTECGLGGNLAQALRLLDIALRQRPMDPVALANRASCLFQAGDYNGVAALRKFLLDPEYQKMSKLHDYAAASLLASMGSALANQGDLRKGLLLNCAAREKVPFETAYNKNIGILGNLLQARGERLSCPEHSDPAQILSN